MADVVILKRSGLKTVGVDGAADTIQALNLKLNGTLWEEADITAHDAHLISTANPHSVNKADVLVGNEIVNADVDASAAIAESKLALDVGTQALQNQITGLASGLLYRGSLAAGSDLTGNSTGNAYLDGDTGLLLGDFFKISSTGDITVSDGTIAVNAGDMLLANKVVASDAAIVIADLDKIDNTDQVASVFGRVGVVVAANGDYNTSQVTENTNLYYTQTRFDSAFTAKDTDSLSEGSSNLYFSDQRAHDAAFQATLDNNSGAQIDAGKVCYEDAALDMKLANATSLSHENLSMLYMAKANIADAASGEFYKPGAEFALTGAKGAIAYLSAAGAIVTTQPVSGDIVMLGKWIALNVFIFEPKYLITL